jgi:hypothetical protein
MTIPAVAVIVERVAVDHVDLGKSLRQQDHQP